MTSLLDARFLAGDFAQFYRFEEEIKRQFFSGKRLERFICAKLDEQKARLLRCGDSISLVEPNVKDGEGGLRDFHTLCWIAKASFPEKEIDSVFEEIGFLESDKNELFEGVNFLWNIRHALHLLENKKNDRLGRELQIQVAQMLGFECDMFMSITEQLMHEYYKNAFAVHLHTQSAIERIIDINFPKPRWKIFLKRKKLVEGIYKDGDKIYASAHALTDSPSILFDLFFLAHSNHLKLDAKTKSLIRNIFQTADDTLFEKEKAAIFWKSILSRIDFLPHILKDMLECKCLEKWIPEMLNIVHRVQHDGYHFYTIEEHSICAIREIEMLLSKEGRKLFPIQASVLSKIKRVHVLTLALLLHDIGKGQGHNHAQKGGQIAGEIAKRIGFDNDDSEAVAFLVKSHLVLPKIAYRRDIKDLNLVARIAEIVGTSEMLDMLYLLAFADIRAIGPNIWSDWKGGLLTQVYQNVLAYLQSGEEKSDRARVIAHKKNRVGEILGGVISSEILSGFFSSMPDRYLFSTSPESIAAHLAMSLTLSDGNIMLDVRQMSGLGFTQITIVAHDAPGLFSKIAGVLSLHGINIIDAEIYTLPNGTALDIMWVTDLLNKPILDVGIWKNIEKELESAVIGVLDIHKLMKRRIKKRFLGEKRIKNRPIVEIDNDVSERETVMDIITADKPGLLYEISKIFFELGCTIDRAKITTHLDRAIDVFYIRDANGEKITSREKLKQIEESIVQAMS